MEKNGKEIQARNELKGLAAHILVEVIKADMSMHHSQIEAWKHFSEYRPRGEMINNDIHIGFARHRYLCLNEAKLSFHIRAIPTKFAARVKYAFEILSGRNKLVLYKPNLYDICSADENGSMEMEILVKRFENGTIKAEYKSVDNTTEELLNEVIY